MAIDIKGTFLDTLDADPAIRSLAEKELKRRRKEEQGDSLFRCLDLIPDETVGIAVKKSGLIFVKNNFHELWSHTVNKALFKQQIIECMLKTGDETLLSLLCKILNSLISVEYSKWHTSLISTILQLINTNNPSTIYIGLLCLIEVLRYHRIHKHKRPIESIVQDFFPTIFDIASSLLDHIEPLAGYIIWKILKIYRIVILIDLFPMLRQKVEIEKWSSLFLRLIIKDYQGKNELLLPFPWEKTSKWSMIIINNLFTYYGTQNDYQFLTKYCPEFSELYISLVLPEVTNHYLYIVNQLSTGSIVLGDRDIQSLLMFFVMCTNYNSLWEMMYPQMEQILSTLIFGSLRLSEQDLENFSAYPQEYILKQSTDVEHEDTSSSHNCAVILLDALVSRRKDVVFSGILEFVNQIMQKHRATPNVFQTSLDKDCALYMLCDISHIVIDEHSTVAAQMEDFIKAYVIPDFELYSQGFLRARLCQFLSMYYKTLTSDDTVNHVYNFVVGCTKPCSSEDSGDNDDKEVPTRTFAQYALLELVKEFESARQLHSFSVTTTMQELLSLYSHIDADLLASTMQGLISIFPDQLLPYSAQLCNQLCHQFTRLTTEITEEEGKGYDDTLASAQEILGNLISILLTLDEYPEKIHEIEPELLPVFETVLAHPEFECQSEIFEMIDVCILTVKEVSNTMWTVFELFPAAFLNYPSLYIEHLLPCLNNFVYYGIEKIHSTPRYIESLSTIIRFVISGENHLGYYDELGKTNVMNTCLILFICGPSGGGLLDQIMHPILEVCFRVILSTDTPSAISSPFILYYLDIIVGAILWNPQYVISFSTNYGNFDAFAEKWLYTIQSNFLRDIYDRKLSILALLKLLRSISGIGNWPWFPKLGESLAKLIHEYRQAIYGEILDEYSPRQLHESQNPRQIQFTFIDETNNFLENFEDENNKTGITVALAEEEMQLVPLTKMALDNIDVFRFYSDVMNWLKLMENTNYERYTNELTNTQKQVHFSVI